MWLRYSQEDEKTHPTKGTYVVQYYNPILEKYRYCEAQFDGVNWACWNVVAYASIPKYNFFKEAKNDETIYNS